MALGAASAAPVEVGRGVERVRRHMHKALGFGVWGLGLGVYVLLHCGSGHANSDVCCGRADVKRHDGVRVGAGVRDFERVHVQHLDVTVQTATQHSSAG